MFLRMAENSQSSPLSLQVSALKCNAVKVMRGYRFEVSIVEDWRTGDNTISLLDDSIYDQNGINVNYEC